MIKYFLVGFLFLSLGISQGIAGVQVGNGGGLAEKYVLFAYQNLGNSIAQFLLSRNPQDVTEYTVLHNIEASLHDEYQNKNQIQFVSESEHPGFFDTAEPNRIAKTGDNVGDVIYINRGQLYPNGAPVSLATATQILVHEFGHHHQVFDHQYLDKLGAEVGQTILENSLEAKFNTAEYNYKAMYLRVPGDSLLVTDGESFVNLSENLNVPDLWCNPGEGLARYTVTNLFWSSQSTQGRAAAVPHARWQPGR